MWIRWRGAWWGLRLSGWSGCSRGCGSCWRILRRCWAMPLPDEWDGWGEYEELVREFPLRVHRWRGEWVCSCPRFGRVGRCRHVVPFLPREDVDVREEFL